MCRDNVCVKYSNEQNSSMNSCTNKLTVLQIYMSV